MDVNQNTTPKLMTKTEALRAMKTGAILTHRYFGAKEYIQNNGYGSLLLSGRYTVTNEEFFRIRSDESWNTGWSTYMGEQHGKG